MEGPRAARAEELAAVVRLANEVFYPEGRIDMGSAFPALFCNDNLPHVRIMLEAGAPVSHVGFTVRDVSLNGAVVRAASLGAVCTRESHRGRGCAALLMEDAIARAREDGAALLLISGGRGLYRRMGCVDAGLYRICSLEGGAAVPPGVTATDWTEEDLPRLQELHQAESVRYVRDAGEMRTLLACRMLQVRPSRTFVVRTEGRVAAYACCNPPNDWTGAEVACVGELGGSRSAILDAAPAMREMLGARVLEVEVPAVDAEWEWLCRGRGMRIRDHGFQGTVKIIDRRGFFSSLEGHVAERLTPAERRDFSVDCGPAVTFHCGSESRVVAEDGDLAALVFGSMERAAPSTDGRLGGILRRLFPLPLPTYGLNYI